MILKKLDSFDNKKKLLTLLFNDTSQDESDGTNLKQSQICANKILTNNLPLSQ